MEKYIVDVTNAKTNNDIQEIIASSITFPEYYGKNLDALYDSLSTAFIKKRVEIVLKGFDKLPSDVYPYGQKVITILKRVSKESIAISDSSLLIINIQ